MTTAFDQREPRGPRGPVRELVSQVEMIVALPAVIDDDAQPLLVRRACLEAFLLAARAMTHFLGCAEGQSRKDDMMATRFVADWTPRAEPANRLRTLVPEVDKQIAHYTTIRIGDNDSTPGTDIEYSSERLREIAKDVAVLWDEFATEAKMPRVGDYFVWHLPDGSGRLATEADSSSP